MPTLFLCLFRGHALWAITSPASRRNTLLELAMVNRLVQKSHLAHVQIGKKASGAQNRSWLLQNSA